MRKLLLALAISCVAGTAFAQPAEKSVIERGRYLATAGDCAACHGDDLAGGAPVASPLGDIYASNITPDRATGIGAWSEAEFARALRQGRAPGKGWLYPAMPYTSYTGLTDQDAAALYAYLHSLKPVSRQVPETRLGFPFLRPAMFGWNLLNLRSGQPAGAVDVQGAAARRGRYLVETLGHCTACHTPRGMLMGERNDRHLAGGMVSGWQAPNITPDPSGIGGWSDAALSRFLRTGHNRFAVAGGEMGLAVQHSLSKLPASDIADMVAYLRQVPPVATTPPAPVAAHPPAIDRAALEAPPAGWQAKTAAASIDGAVLYQGACASCHGPSGNGAAGPDLAENVDVRAASPNNLVQVIAHGVRLPVGDTPSLMPGLRDQLTDAQIAAVASYVRASFAGRPAATVSADQVGTILSGRTDPGWLIRHAAGLAWAAIAAAVLVVLLLALLLVRTRRPHPAS